LTLSSRNVWISSVDSPSDALANWNSFSTGVKCSSRSARRSARLFLSRG
jgi:hypothetical protein